DHQTLIIANTELLDEKDVLIEFIEKYYRETEDRPKYVNADTAMKIESAPPLQKPQRGWRKKLLALGLTNARQLATASLSSWEKQEQAAVKALTQIQKGLALKDKPARIEVYDISNIQGVYAVGSMVVFTHGRPDKKEYKRFQIKGTTGPDDPHMMQEVVARRLNHTDWPVADLMILDGGKSQLSVVSELSNLNKNKVVALAKQNEILYTTTGQAIRFKTNSPAFLLIQRMRDEAHRFAISYYRQRHTKGNIISKLDEIPGIGPKTKKILKQKYGSWENVKQAPNAELEKLIGPAKTKLIKNS
ncbi:MAG: hypothetical protein NUV82_00970, partial [Candidatus Komeilibacteria bacterium]|nr:hypothetical protein [Candidatus Komeilibacteria bacterium]